MRTSLPCHSAGRNGSGGALRMTAQVVELVRRLVGETAELGQELLRLIERMHDKSR